MADQELPDVLRPLLAGRTARHDVPTAYVCQNMTCGPPATTLDELLQLL
jgi:hypothetical protein